jgi:hypothetical protein
MILPEGRVAPSVGERAVVLSINRIVTINPDQFLRKKRVQFQIHVIHRIRSIPNDRFGCIYIDDNDLAHIHDAIVEQIESYTAYTSLKTLAASEKLTDTFVTTPGVPEGEEANRPERFSVTRTFIHHTTHLDPIHLYASYFLSKSDQTPSRNSNRIAGYRTYSSFTSPVFTPNHNPLNCEDLYVPE